jgi:hypothetical protein
VVPLLRGADGPFEKKLTKDQQILHSLNRLTFGPRPGDVEAMRKLGVEKWIELQLHPDQIPENPVLELKLKPLETLRMDPGEILKSYSPVQLVQPFTPLTDLLSQDQIRRVQGGTHEERMATLDTLDAEKRKKVLALIGLNTFSCEPGLQKEAEAARKDRQQEQQMEFRRRNPNLNDLLNPDQMAAALRGAPEQLRDLFSYLDPEKRKQVAGALPPQSLSGFPDLRREGMRARQPLQVVLGDLREGKVFRAVYSNRQLEEILVDFWFNHFNVYEGKSQDRQLLVSYERDAIRPHVFGPGARCEGARDLASASHRDELATPAHAPRKQRGDRGERHPDISDGQFR